MTPVNEKSQLKRARQSVGEQPSDTKKPRRSERIQSQVKDHDTVDKFKNQTHLPSPITHKDTTVTDESKEGTTTPPPAAARQSQNYLSSPPSDTQQFSQFVYPPTSLPLAIQDEKDQGVWGYLVPLDSNAGDTLVLKSRSACPTQAAPPTTKERKAVHPNTYVEQEERYEKEKMKHNVAGGYLIGRHPECDRVIDNHTISNRHCLFFCENKGGGVVAMLEDLSSNGTFVNEALVGRNNRRELAEGAEIGIVNEARFIFRYARDRDRHGFMQQFSIQEQLGKGHFASVYLCIEKNTGVRYAVKKFEKRSGPAERSKVEGLQQEIAVLMGVSHPSLLCLKSTYDEDDGVYIVLELAPEGELFNWIVRKQKLDEGEARKVFVQLFQAVKYLHERNIVHRDIKPENILLIDADLHVKLADFGLAKIIGEESFTTTLCGTPSYVAPEILESSSHRRYTRAVDVWSLGVVLYICLCGFPPFSDELNTPENPYTLSQQIKLGRFDYPSPYWDPVHDEALDLIDRMLTVDYSKRATIDDCLQHPWTTGRIGSQAPINPNDSTDGLTGAMGALDFSKRKPQRERTLLSELNDIKLSRVIESQDQSAPPVKVFEKNPDTSASNGRSSQSDDARHVNIAATKARNEKKADAGQAKVRKEGTPAANRAPEEFMLMGGKGDEALFGEPGESRYAT